MYPDYNNPPGQQGGPPPKPPRGNYKPFQGETAESIALRDPRSMYQKTPLEKASNYVDRKLHYAKRKFQNSEFGSAAGEVGRAVGDMASRVKENVSNFADSANSKIHAFGNSLQVEAKRLPARIKDEQYFAERDTRLLNEKRVLNDKRAAVKKAFDDFDAERAIAQSDAKRDREAEYFPAAAKKESRVDQVKNAVKSGVTQFKDNLGSAVAAASTPLTTFKKNASADINRAANFVKQGVGAVRQGVGAVSRGASTVRQAVKSVTGFKKGGRVQKKGKYLVHKKEYVLPKKVKPTKSQKLRVAKRNKK
jgi:hypothetical protein